MRTAKLCLLFLVATPILAAIDLPPAPSGFTWQDVPELKSAFLRPSGWHFKTEKHGKNLAYFITKEEIDEDGQFKTGLTINVFRKLKKGRVRDEARKLIDGVSAQCHAGVSMMLYDAVIEMGCQATVSTHNVSTETYNLLVTNPDTNTVYWFIFESPESEWNSAWKTGEAMMENLAIEGQILSYPSGITQIPGAL